MSEVNRNHKSAPVSPPREISRRELLKKLSPLGKLKLDSSRCTGCGLCAAECPAGALVISPGREADVFQLLFKYGNCMACGLCVEICPEKCLLMERILEPGEVGNQSVLFEDRIVRCAGCGSPLGPKSMLDIVQVRVMAAGKQVLAQSELCPDCKVRAQLDKLRV